MSGSKKTERLLQWFLRSLNVWSKPRNFSKTIISAVPFASPVVEMQNQLDGVVVEERLDALEDSDLTFAEKLLRLEQAQPRVSPPPQDWPEAVDQFHRRTVQFSVWYDAGFHSPAERGTELFLTCGHGCLIAPDLVLTCSEVLERMQGIAEQRRGTAGVTAGMRRYSYVPEKIDEDSGLVICHITRSDDAQWESLREKIEAHGLSAMIENPLDSEVKYSLTPWLGQDVGFLHTGAATDVSTAFSFHGLQFDNATISHFRPPKDGALKSFVTSAIQGQVQMAGSPVFSRGGVLLGVIAGSQRYKPESGDRIIVKSLLGHPRLTKFPKTDTPPAGKK